VFYLDHDGQPRSVAANLPPSLHRYRSHDELAPWQQDLGPDPVIVDLGPGLAAVAEAAGFVACLASRVADPIHPEGATILIWTTNGGPTVAGHHYDMENMRRALRLVLQQRAQVSLLERAARIDELTGLVSRARFFELLDQAEEQSPPGSRHALLYVDLDGFKSVNDSLGHAAGDQVLRVAAERLLAVAPHDAVVARMGGDEFVIHCHPDRDPAEAAAVAEHVVAAFSEPVQVLTTTALVGASVGVAVGSPDEPPRALLEAADQALFTAKSGGRGRWHLLS
jgi:diguanylate cyclase (GGDEF)-like protein